MAELPSAFGRSYNYLARGIVSGPAGGGANRRIKKRVKASREAQSKSAASK
jgi:hypothetical protein